MNERLTEQLNTQKIYRPTDLRISYINKKINEILSIRVIFFYAHFKMAGTCRERLRIFGVRVIL